MIYDLNVLIKCPLCGQLYQAHVLDHKPTAKEIAEINRKADEDHRKLHELRKIESRFERIDEE